MPSAGNACSGRMASPIDPTAWEFGHPALRKEAMCLSGSRDPVHPPQGSMAHMQKVRDSWIQPLGGPPTPSIYNATPYATHLAQWIKRETREYRLFTIADWFLWALWKNRRCDLERKKLRPNRYLQILKKDDDNNNNKRWQGRMSRFVVSLDDKTRTNRW